MAAAIMLQGTGSDVGKTVLVAGLCRLATRRGLRVRPFKPQNMSNNAAIARGSDGIEGEIGRAQWLQALACGCPPSLDMNPVLLKPQSETGSQIVVHGQVRGTAKGRDYQKLKAGFMDAVLESFGRLSAEADLVVVEGAGSPAEVNLRANDIANMGFARAATVPVVLVGDIDRGGVIASLVGTQAVLDPADRVLIRGYLINKFRGDVTLFDDGLRIVTAMTGWPSLGVVPWLSDAMRLPAEDSVVLERMSRQRGRGTVRIVVPVLPRIANFDDIDPLKAEPGVDLQFVGPNDPFPQQADLVILPGSKATLADLKTLYERGWDHRIRELHESGTTVLGFCGGYQMLGRRLSDPEGVEGGGEMDGLGLLDVSTVLERRKITRNVRATSADGQLIEAYEIHMGRTVGPDRDRPFAFVEAQAEGAVSVDGTVAGTYLHGAFGSGAFRQAWLARFGVASTGTDERARIEATLDAVADRLAETVDFDRFLSIAKTHASRTICD